MIGDRLQRKLQPLKEAEDRIFVRWLVTVLLLVGAGAWVLMIWLAAQQQWFASGVILLILILVTLAAWLAAFWKKRQAFNFKKLAGRIEGEFPDLQQLLVTAVQQEPREDGKLSFLQQQVIEQAVDHALQHGGWEAIYRPSLLVATWVQGFAVVNVLVMTTALLFYLSKEQVTSVVSGEVAEAGVGLFDLSVLPGDAEVERGARLLVEANFVDNIPAEAELVLSASQAGDKRGGERARIKMKQGLQDGEFAGLIGSVDEDVSYRIEFAGGRSGEYKVTTYSHPELQRVDVEVTPPDYSGLEKRELRDVRKLSVLEGARLQFVLQINKPVVAAELYGEDETVIELFLDEGDGSILRGSLLPNKSQRYRVHLVDADDRVNKQPPWVKVNLKKNEPAQIEWVFPKRDLVVSAVQELVVEARVWDDLGVTASGAVFVMGDEEKRVALSSEVLQGEKKHLLKTLLAIEKLGAKPRDLISYYLWAEDRDAKGKVRRVMSDLFFAEVRHFEDIFREAQAMSGNKPAEQGESDKLVDLQKEVINATWKVMRRASAGELFEELGIDVQVVKDSQQIVVGKVDGVLEKIEDAKIRTYLESAKAKMLQAVLEWGGVLQSQAGGDLTKPMKSSRHAYEDLLLAQGREHQVSRSQSAKPGGGKQKMRSQLMQLELKQQEKRYEKASEAMDQPAQSLKQKENLGVLNRLKELARRQQALAEKIKRLQGELAAANSAAEKSELKKQLKRLQQQQQQLLRDLDDVTERMQQPENWADMVEARKKLEQTREKVREASEQLADEKLADAVNSATRAQRELNEVKKGFVKKTSQRFNEEMRAIRDQARDLAEQQKKMGEKLEKSAGDESEEADPFRNQEQLLKNLQRGRELGEQGKKVADLLQKMREISEAAEGSEALLSTALYEGVRKAQTQGVEKALKEANELIRMGRADLAQEAEGRAARSIDELKKNVEKAASKVLGNEGDALRMARSELDDLLREVEKEKNAMAGTGEKKSEQAVGGGEGKPSSSAERSASGKKAGAKMAGPASNKGPSGGGQGKKTGSGEPSSAPLFFEGLGAGEQSGEAPLAGGDYEKWSERLRDVEQALGDQGLRNQAARVLDNAREMRIDHHRSNLPPQANDIDQKIIAPLVELRDGVSEHLSRLDKKNPLAPIDRDPVAPEYKALVRKYYQQLGGGK